MTLLANGVDAGLPFDDALAVASTLVKTGRAIPVNEWVESIVSEQQSAALDSLF